MGMKIKKGEPITVNIELFGCEVTLITRKKDLAMVKKYSKQNYDFFKKGGFLGACSGNGRSNFIVLNDLEVSTLAHEILHAIHRISDNYGIEDEETRCYMMCYMLGKFGV